MNSIDRVMKNSFVLMAQEICAAIISIGVTGYIARCLGNADYGIFCFSTAFVTLIAAFTGMGLRPLTIRAVAKQIDNAGSYLDRMIFTRIILSLATVLLISVSVKALGYPKRSIFIVYLATTGFFFSSISMVFKDAFQGFEKMEFVALTEFIVRLFTAIFSIVFLYMGYRLVVVATVYTVGHFVGLSVAALFLSRYFVLPRPKVDLRFSFEQIKRGLPFALSGVLVILYLKIDVTMLSKMAGDSAVGLYSAAVNLTRNMGFIAGPIASAAYPAFARTYVTSREETSRIFGKYFIYLLLAGLPMAIGITLVARNIIFLIYGPTYADSVLILQIIAWALPFSFLVMYQRFFLQAIGMQTLAMLVTAGTVVVNISLNGLLIPRYQGVGAATATVASAVSGFVCLMYIVSRKLAEPIELKRCMKIVLASSILGLFIVFFPWNSLPIVIPSSALIYVSALLLSGAVSKQDLFFFKFLLRSGRS